MKNMKTYSINIQKYRVELKNLELGIKVTHKNNYITTKIKSYSNTVEPAYNGHFWNH